MTPQKLTRITQAHAQAVYAWALEEHYRQAEKHARRQKKEAEEAGKEVNQCQKKSK